MYNIITGQNTSDIIDVIHLHVTVSNSTNNEIKHNIINQNKSYNKIARNNIKNHFAHNKYFN